MEAEEEVEEVEEVSEVAEVAQVGRGVGLFRAQSELEPNAALAGWFNFH